MTQGQIFTHFIDEKTEAQRGEHLSKFMQLGSSSPRNQTLAVVLHTKPLLFIPGVSLYWFGDYIS